MVIRVIPTSSSHASSYKCKTWHPSVTGMNCCREGEKFDVPADALEAAYRQLQRQLHPDKFSTGSKVGQTLRTLSNERPSAELSAPLWP